MLSKNFAEFGESYLNHFFLTNKMFQFTILHRDGKARTGVIKTGHGEIKTPAFIPVATKATIKSLTMEQFQEIGFDSLLCNTYHLYLQPGPEVVQKLGGLHQFMGFNQSIWTDSGGFQVFSLKDGGKASEDGTNKDKAKENKASADRINNGCKVNNGRNGCKVNDEGVEFTSHIDHSKHFLTPEKSMQIQHQLGADIIFTFDECVHFDDSYEKTKRAMERTHQWTERCLKEFKRLSNQESTQESTQESNKTSNEKSNKKSSQGSAQALFGIVQGGRFRDLREESAKFISSRDFPGFGIGGIFGDPTKEIHGIVKHTMQFLPADKPKHMLGIGSVEDLFDYIEFGADTFDCVLPTRLARMGYLFLTPKGGGSIKNKFRMKITARHKGDKNPIDRHCSCYTCRNFSRAYLRHLWKARELLFHTLATEHNLFFFHSLMGKLRKSIEEKRFRELKKEWLGKI